MLKQVDTDLWVAEQPLSFVGVRLGTRMTLVRLRDGSLLVHSPIRLTPELRAEIDALGAVRQVISPNCYHHLFAGDFARAYPEARLHGAPGLAQKRHDLSFATELGETPDPAWEGDLAQVPLLGTLLRETIFYHPKTRTIVSSDLTENFTTSEHWLTRGYLKVGGIHGKIGLSRLLRPLFRDRAAARRSVDRLLQWDFQRIVIAHGDIIEHGARDALAQTYAWLK